MTPFLATGCKDFCWRLPVRCFLDLGRDMQKRTLIFWVLTGLYRNMSHPSSNWEEMCKPPKVVENSLSHENTRLGHSRWTWLSDQPLNSLPWTERWDIWIDQYWSGDQLWHWRLTLSYGTSNPMEMGEGGPCDKTEKEDEMNAEQPTAVSSQSLSIQTEGWSERMLCLQWTRWGPGPVWVNIFLQVG